MLKEKISAFIARMDPDSSSINSGVGSGVAQVKEMDIALN